MPEHRWLQLLTAITFDRDAFVFFQHTYQGYGGRALDERPRVVKVRIRPPSAPAVTISPIASGKLTESSRHWSQTLANNHFFRGPGFRVHSITFSLSHPPFLLPSASSIRPVRAHSSQYPYARLRPTANCFLPDHGMTLQTIYGARIGI